MRAILTVLAFTVLAAPAMAQRGDRPKLDTDGDGYISPEEFSQSKLAERVEFSAIDTDGDELLSAEEIRSFMRERGRDRRRQRNDI